MKSTQPAKQKKVYCSCRIGGSSLSASKKQKGVSESVPMSPYMYGTKVTKDLQLGLSNNIEQTNSDPEPTTPHSPKCQNEANQHSTPSPPPQKRKDTPPNSALSVFFSHPTTYQYSPHPVRSPHPQPETATSAVISSGRRFKTSSRLLKPRALRVHHSSSRRGPLDDTGET